MTPQNKTEWHLDRKVPIGLIVAFMLQAVGLVIWGANIDSAVRSLQKDVYKITQDKAHDIDTTLADERRVTRLEVIQEEVARRLGTLDKKMDEILGYVKE